MRLGWFVLGSLILHCLAVFWPLPEAPLGDEAPQGCRTVAVSFGAAAPVAAPETAPAAVREKAVRKKPPQKTRRETKTVPAQKPVVTPAPQPVPKETARPVDVPEPSDTPVETAEETPEPVETAVADAKPAQAEAVAERADASVSAADAQPVRSGLPAGQASGEPAEVRFGGAAGPAFAKFVQPEYPSRARRRGVEGQVLLRILIGPEGRAREVAVLQSAGRDLDAAARKSVQLSEFRPLTRNGVPLPCWTVLPVTFRLR